MAAVSSSNAARNKVVKGPLTHRAEQRPPDHDILGIIVVGSRDDIEQTFVARHCPDPVRRISQDLIATLVEEITG
jgi:hypothetical protein